VIEKAFRKYSFSLNIDGVTYRGGYDRQKDTRYIRGPDTAAELADLAGKVETIIRETKPDLDPHDARRFLSKHLLAMIRVEQELQRTPLSECLFELVDSSPFDTKEMSLEEQCFLEVLQEQSEQAKQAAVANGTPDDVTYEVTIEMVEAKMKEKLRQLTY
jgi:hypothetical protein